MAASAIVTLLGVLSAGCGGSAEADSASTGGGADRLSIATTVSPITNIVANIGGERVTIRGLIPEGTNSHTFEPPPSAAKTLSRADVVFVNGLELETPTADLAADNRKDGAETVKLGDLALPEAQYLFDFSFPQDAGKPNPHLWTDPLMVRKYAASVEAMLSRRDPDNADYYATNLAGYTAKIDALDQALRAATATMRPEQRKLLTYHDAYAYFARDYGWQVIGAVQPSDFEEPTASEVADLIRQVKAQKVPAIFGSEVFASPVLEQIAAETGARYIDDLRDDDLPGEPGDADHSLLALLKFNFITMVEALGGDATALKAVDVSDIAPDSAEYPQ